MKGDGVDGREWAREHRADVEARQGDDPFRGGRDELGFLKRDADDECWTQRGASYGVNPTRTWFRLKGEDEAA